MAAILPKVKKQLGPDGTYVIGLAHDGGSMLVCTTTANDVSIIDIITGQILNKHCIEAEIVGVQYVNQVLYFLDRRLNVHQADRRAQDHPLCKALTVPYDFDGVTAATFNENYATFATCCFDPSGDYVQSIEPSGSEDEADDEEAKNPIWVFDIRNFEQVLVEADAHSDVVSSLAFKGDLIVSGGLDGLVNIVDPSAPEEEYLTATIPINSAVDHVGVFKIKDAPNMMYATTDDYRWNLLRMNSPDDVDNVMNRRVLKNRKLVDMVGLPREDFPVATVEYSTEDTRMHLIGSSLDGTKSSIIGEYTFHKALPRVAKFVDGTLFTGGEDGFVAGFPVDLRDADGKTIKERFKSRGTPY